MNENENIYKGKKNTEVLGLIKSPITFFYQKFKFVNNFNSQNEETDVNNEFLKRFLSYQTDNYSKEYNNDSSEFTRNLWLSLIKTKEIVVGEEKSLTEVYINAENYGISRDHINNFAYLNVSNVLNELIKFKEEYFHLVDWKKAGKNISYQRLKRNMFALYPEFIAMKDDNLCALLRNTIAHNNFELSGDKGKVMINLYPKGKADGTVISVSLQLLREYLQQLNNLIDGAIIKFQNSKRIAIISNGYLKIKNEEFLKDNPHAKNKYYRRDNLAKFFKQKNEIFMSLNQKRRKSKNTVLSEVNFNFNEIMCEDPNFEYIKLNEELNRRLPKLAQSDSVFSAWECANTKHFLLCQDAISYAQFVLTSNFYDKNKDYETDENVKRIVGYDANQKINQIRNSLMHGWYTVLPNETIKICDLNAHGADKLKEFRKKDKRLRRAGDVEVADAIELREAEFSITSNDLQTVGIYKRQDIIQICEAIYENYSENKFDTILS